MRVWQPRDWFLTCASLYCTFRPISPTAAIAQWALQGAPALWHRSCVRIPWWYYNFLPAGLRVAQPCRYCFYSMVQNGVFAPQERHVAPINVKFGTGRHSPVGIVFHVYQKENVGIQPPKLKKFRILASNLTRLQYFYEILSICTRL